MQTVEIHRCPIKCTEQKLNDDEVTNNYIQKDEMKKDIPSPLLNDSNRSVGTHTIKHRRSNFNLAAALNESY